MMKTRSKSVLLFLPLFALLIAHPFQTMVARQVSVSSTPTYDPLAEPPLPPNPTEYELGRNLYWHWCMTCHGDKGQGLTDEFRGIWDPDHQNCWGRGCHSGRPGEMGFPIPTVVPALVDENHLARFASLQELTDFLEATHPPQSPGSLKNEEYQAIALFVFTMNGRSPDSILIANTPLPTQTLTPSKRLSSISFPVSFLLILSMLLLTVLAFLRIRAHSRK